MWNRVDQLMFVLFAGALQLPGGCGSAAGGPLDEGSAAGGLQQAALSSWSARCRRQGVADPTALLEAAREQALQCAVDQLHLNQLQQEVEEHMARGDLDTLFTGRCHQLPGTIALCLQPALDALRRCLSEAERRHNVTELLIESARAGVEFLCYRDGERMAIFLGEQGRQCVEANSTRNATQVCLHRHGLQDQLMESLLESLLTGSTEYSCRRVFEAHDCLVAALETCSESTASNVIDSLLKAMQKPLPCRRPVSSVSSTSHCSLVPVIGALVLLRQATGVL